MKFYPIKISCIFLLLSLNAAAQRPGLIVTTHGDTLRGDIKYQNLHKTPQTLYFRLCGQLHFTKYDAGSIQYFETDADRYLRAEVWIDQRPVDYHLDANDILYKESVRLEKDTVFLKCLVLGPKYNFLELIDFNKKHYYLMDNAGKVIPLDYKVFLNSRGNIEIMNGFRETLILINRKEKNDPSIEAAIRGAHYAASSLSKIIEAINNSAGEVYHKCVPKPSGKNSAFFIGTAAGITRILLRQYSGGLQSGTGTIAGLFAGVDFWDLRFDVLAGRVQYFAEQGLTQYHILEYNIIPSIKLRCPLVSSDKFQMHIGAGFMVPIVLSSNQKIGGEKFNYSSDVKFPWATWTAGGHIDIQINKRWETGITCYNAASIDVGNYGADAMHCYTWLAYRFN